MALHGFGCVVAEVRAGIGSGPAMDENLYQVLREAPWTTDEDVTAAPVTDVSPIASARNDPAPAAGLHEHAHEVVAVAPALGVHDGEDVNATLDCSVHDDVNAAAAHCFGWRDGRMASWYILSMHVSMCWRMSLWWLLQGAILIMSRYRGMWSSLVENSLWSRSPVIEDFTVTILDTNGASS